MGIAIHVGIWHIHEVPVCFTCVCCWKHTFSASLDGPGDSELQQPRLSQLLDPSCFPISINTESNNFTTESSVGISVGTTCTCVCCGYRIPLEILSAASTGYKGGEENPLFGEKTEKVCP